MIFHVDGFHLNDVRRHIGFFQLGGEREHHILLGCLGGEIHTAFGGRVGDGGRRDRNDPSPAVFRKWSFKGFEQIEGGADVLVDHEIQIVNRRFGEGLAAAPAADEMEQGVDRAEFGENSLGRVLKRLPIEQVHGLGVESL